MNSSTAPARAPLSTRSSFALSAVLGGLGLLSGCGLAGASAAVSPAPGATPAPITTPSSSGVVTDAFFIDDGAGVTLPEDAFSITVNGEAWALTWRGDYGFHDFTGEIVNGSRIDGVTFAGGYAGDWVSQPEPGRVQFGASTDGYNLQSITLASASEPLRFNLYVDGYPATYAVVFSSGGIESTSDVMPFDLMTAVTARAGRAAPRFSSDTAALRSVTANQGLAQATTDSSAARRPVFVPAPARVTQPAAAK